MWTATCGRALCSTIVQIKAAGAGLVCYVTPFTSPSILKLYKVWKNYKNKYLSIFIILLTSSASALDELEPLNWGGILVLGDELVGELAVGSPGDGAPDGKPPPSVAAVTLVWTRTWLCIFVGSFFLLLTTWDSSATYLFHFGWVHLLVDILTNATNNQRVSV